MGAEKLVILTDVEGLYADWPNSTDVVRTIFVSELRELIGGLSTGMVPKMTACLDAVDAGVPRAHIIDGRIAHSLLLEIYTAKGIGTEIIRD